ncbi:MAG TPA: DUF6687 family protein [Pyrinomonadaceae bacterium]|jgi:hypothetical protein
MRFEYYDEKLDSVPKLSVDGTVENSIHFSHWQGNRTPASVKADTSTEIALNLAASPERAALTQGIELVTNNHFDTDGVLSVWTMLNAERAPELRGELIAAAEAGDFSEYSTPQGVRASLVIQGSEQAGPEEEAGSPLANQLAGERVTDEARSYALVLPEVLRVITRTDEFEPLWRKGWERVEAAMESFARGASRVLEYTDARLSVVTLAPELFSPKGFDPTRHAAPFTAISHHARGQLFLICAPTAGGWSYRVDYPYYSWAETVVRPRVERSDFAQLLARLNELERNGSGRWRKDTGELASAFKFVDSERRQTASSLAPEHVAEQVRAFLIETSSGTEPSHAGAVQDG